MALGGLPEKQPENDPALGEDMVGMALRALKSKGQSPKPKVNLTFSDIFEEIYGVKYCACGCSVNDADLVVKDRDAKEIKLWKSLVAGRRGTINNFIAKFNRVLMAARAEVIGKLERAAALEKSVVTKHVAADFEFNLAAFEKSFEVSMRAVAADALQKSGDQVYAELGKDDPWKMPPAESIKFLKERTKKLEGVPADVARRIRNTIQDGLTNGDPLAKIATAVRGEFNDISKGRATVIAQTETSAAYGKGRHSAMESAGVQYKQWLTSGNANVRLAHLWMNGKVIALDEPFVVTNADGETDEVQHPGDDDGEAWNVINCHCVEIASAEGPAEPEDPNAE
ncbi:MAG: phage minor head protein [Verrucomicrobia bacterium]|nr:phage minor head protein [Verrucomicrobiota bacterium]